MADKDRGAGHAMFGLNDPETPRPGGAGQPPSAPSATNIGQAYTAAPVSPTATPQTPQAPQTFGQQPQYVYVQSPPPPAAPVPVPGASTLAKVLAWLVAFLIVLAGVNLYLVITSRQQLSDIVSKQSDELNLLTRRLNDTDARYAQLRGAFQVTSEKLGLTQQELTRARNLASNIQKQQQQSVEQLNAAIAQKASAEELNKAQTEANQKMSGLSGDIAGTRKDLEDTKAALTGAKGELSGAIARTHDELVTLAHKGDRDYFEFSLAGKNARQKVGTITLELRHINTKKNQFTVAITADDKTSERKDKAILEPLYIIVSGAPSALEMVVNKLGKNSIAGYVSAPKGFFTNTPNVLSSRPGA